ncbi:venom acid phosphatase Acph-1-like [Chelonus insularis]|uniref:venom acid phosphatase Acph-1-like n=1 Tax=Chelonus insularis TaxID=460826 RepID=UPI00158E9A49|nr:venom acid phosphatase Acph-1-like [Chelonus insularis]
MLRVWILLLLIRSTISELELKLVHIVFSHKLYAPIERDDANQIVLPKKLDYQYFLENADTMVNSAKLDLFNFGRFLRHNYNDYLGDTYHPDIMEMRTTEHDLSMISGLLVDAGLWPPIGPQKWNKELDWQPIPTDYVPAKYDYLLLGALCPTFVDDIQETPFAKEIINYKPLFNYLTKNLGFQISHLYEVEMLYAYFDTLVDYNISLPRWVDTNLYPDGHMKTVTLLSYNLLSQTLLQKQLNGGTLLKRIINKSFDHQNSNGTSKLKISLFSVEQRNIIGLLQAMDKWNEHILNRNTAIFFELYANTTDHYLIKMYYWSDGKLESFKLNDCDDYCSLDHFQKLLHFVLPEDEKSLCTFSRANSKEKNKYIP